MNFQHAAVFMLSLICSGAALADSGVHGQVTDTFALLHDRFGNVIDLDDNGSMLGNGWASGFHGIGAADGFADDGDGTFSIRLIVTGRPDGLDGLANGLFQNLPHCQIGRFEVVATYYDGADMQIGSDSYASEFISGSDAFIINFEVPAGVASADVDINNDFPVVCDPADINGDGIVDSSDLGILIGSFGLSCE